MHQFAVKPALRLAPMFAVFAAALHFSSVSAATVNAPSVHASAVSTASTVTFETVPTQFIDANGTRIAYRRYGKRDGVPLVFFQHFVGNLDSWDPKVIDGLSHDREVIVFDNAGVGSSGGDVPTTIEAMAKQAIAFMHALNITKADLLGFSMGSLVAQDVAIQQPHLVRRVVLVGSGPRGGAGMATLTPEFQGFLTKKRTPEQDLLLDVFFTPSAASQAAGHAFLKRIHARTVDRDEPINDKVAPAQVAAFAAWGAPASDANDYLKQIRQPVLVVSGSHDIVHYTINSYTLQQNLPNAQLIIYPDSNHGALYQYPDLFLKDVTTFLDQPA